MSNIVEVTTAADPVDPPPNPGCDMFSGSQQQIPLAVQRAGLPTCASNGEGIGVAIVDTGLDFGHPDLNLAPDNPGVTSFNALGPGTTCQDVWSHGTHVGGIVAALDNNTGIVGVAPNATLYCVKVGATDAGEIFESDLFAGLEWVIAQHDQVDPPIKVVNISLGGPAGDPTDAQYQALITQLYNLGIVVVTSAGNDETMEVSQLVPAGFSEVISVAGTIAETGVELCGYFPPVQADTASSFTTDGGVTVSAIAEERNDAIVSGFSCLFLLYGTLSTTMNGNASRKLPTPTQLAEARGTSFAAPVVAGIAARIMQRDLGSLTGTSADVEAVRAEIEGSADRIGVAPLVHPWGGPGKLFPDVTPDGVMEGIAQAP
jgi:subtilisin family serine protease